MSPEIINFKPKANLFGHLMTQEDSHEGLEMTNLSPIVLKSSATNFFVDKKIYSDNAKSNGNMSSAATTRM